MHSPLVLLHTKFDDRKISSRLSIFLSSCVAFAELLEQHRGALVRPGAARVDGLVECSAELATLVMLAHPLSAPLSLGFPGSK